MSAATDPPIICFSAVDWDYLTMREHQILSRLAHRHPVLYVEEQSHLLSLVRAPRKVRKLWQWTRRPRPVATNLWVYTPVIMLPLGRVVEAINAVNQWVLTALVRRAARALGWSRPILWLYEPDQYRQIGRYAERLVVYDCADRHDAFVRLQRPALVRRMEQRLCDRADIILTVSAALTDAIGPRRCHLVPNGTDFAFFRATLAPELAIADDLAAVARPVVGYVGTIDSRVDVELLEAAARQIPEATFVFVGPAQADVRRLRGLPNVRLLGRRPYTLLPRYLKGFDACVLPFRRTPLTIAGCPIKLYDYLAAGKTVVATDIPEARRFRRGVLVATNRAEFIRFLREGITHPLPPEIVSAQMAGETWDDRAAAIMRLLDEHLDPARAPAAS
jgi:glycosyltransferase involved in cell wall biosynthesis